MTKKVKDGSVIAAELLAKLDRALAETPLSGEKQLADVEQFRADIARLCKEGRESDARRAARLCMMLIRQGDPAKE